MSSKKGSGNPSSMATSSGTSSKGKGVADVDQLTHGVSGMNVNSAQDEGWEVFGKKSKNKSGSTGPKPWGPPQQQPTAAKTWGQPDTMQKLGMRAQSGRGSGQTRPAMPSDSRKPAGRGYVAAVIPPPPKNGWGGWSARQASSQSSGENDGHREDAQTVNPLENDEDDDDDDDLDDSDDELHSDDFDSDESQKSHDTMKQNRWFKDIFCSLDKLTIEEINEPERQWHCPACKGGPGAIDWYRGLQPLITHCKTKRSKRVKLHRELAELLDEELRRRGTSAVPAGEIFGKWKGLEERADKEIVWPPMVVVMNTRLEKDDNEKWIGMGNQELLDYFSSYSAVKARHSYGPQGHRGMSLLIFESSAVGYAEAERLSKHFEDKCRDRLAWERNRVPFYPGGTRQLYGYMAEKPDMDSFNQHSPGKMKLKYEMKSYREMVVKQMKQMSEDNQLLLHFKNKVSKEQKSKKALEESYIVMTEKFRQSQEENRAAKLKTKKHHELTKQQLDYQEQFYKEHIQPLYDARNATEDNFEKTQQDEREKVVAQSETNLRAEEIAKSIQLHDEKLKQFNNERDKLLESQEARRMKQKQRHMEEDLVQQEEFQAEFNNLFEKYKSADGTPQ